MMNLMERQELESEFYAEYDYLQEVFGEESRLLVQTAEWERTHCWESGELNADCQDDDCIVGRWSWALNEMVKVAQPDTNAHPDGFPW